MAKTSSSTFPPTGTTEAGQGTRYLQENVTLFDRIRQYFCVPQSEYYPLCECIADETVSTLDVICVAQYDCVTLPSKCGVNVTDCVTFNIDFNVTGPTEYSRRSCYDFAQPYEQKVCYETSVTNLTKFDSCTVEFNGIVCNSCQVEVVEYEKCVLYALANQTTCYNTTKECYYFDCGNTEGGHSGTSCEAEGIKIYKFLDTYMCLDRCDICGEGINLTNPDKNLTVPGYDYEYNCGDLLYRGSYGYFTETECVNVKEAANLPCGCGAETVTNNPEMENDLTDDTNTPTAPTVETSPSSPPLAAVADSSSIPTSETVPVTDASNSGVSRPSLLTMMMTTTTISLASIIFGSRANLT